MKLLLFSLMSGICILPMNNHFDFTEKKILPTDYLNKREKIHEIHEINFQEKPGQGRISSIVFKNQDYCRAELEDFEFDAHFSIVSATVYFSGANFKSVQKGFITSNSLKPIKNLMTQCLPGSIVVFDEVKVKGPDNEIRMIQGVSLLLY